MYSSYTPLKGSPANGRVFCFQATFIVSAHPYTFSVATDGAGPIHVSAGVRTMSAMTGK